MGGGGLWPCGRHLHDCPYHDWSLDLAKWASMAAVGGRVCLAMFPNG